MATLTSWSLTSPNGTHFQPSISTEGVVTWAIVGAAITVTPPVYVDEAAGIWTPSISNAGVVTLTAGADTSQDRAALLDSNGVQYVAVVRHGVSFFQAPQVQVGDLVVFGLYADESVEMLVKSIEPGPEFTARLMLIDAAPGVHLAATGAIPPFESQITLPRVGLDAVPTPQLEGIASDEAVMLRSSDGSLAPRLVLTVRFGSGSYQPVTALEVQYRRTGQSSWRVLRVESPSGGTVPIALTEVEDGETYDLRVRTLGAIGVASDWLTVDAYTVIGKTSSPPNVTALSWNDQRLVWAYPEAPPDLAGFVVRVHVGTRTSWSDALPLHDGLISATTFPLFRDSGVRTYLVKARDTSGNESLAAATVLVDYGQIATQNVEELLDLQTLGFPGTLTGGTVFGGYLLADSSSAAWTDDAAPYWTGDANPVWTGGYREMVYEAEIIPPAEWLGGTLLLELAVEGTGWHLDYAQDGSGQFWSTDPSSPAWTDDAAPYWSTAPDVFVPWTGSLVNYARQAYRFRLTTLAGAIAGRCTHFQAIFDMPDVEEFLPAVVLSASGTRLSLVQTYRSVEVVAPVLLINSGTATHVRVMDKDVSGPLLMAFDGTGSPVDTIADVTVKGY